MQFLTKGYEQINIQCLEIKKNLFLNFSFLKNPCFDINSPVSQKLDKLLKVSGLRLQHRRHLAPTIVLRESPELIDLVQEYHSRFQSKKVQDINALVQPPAPPLFKWILIQGNTVNNEVIL